MTVPTTILPRPKLDRTFDFSIRNGPTRPTVLCSSSPVDRLPSACCPVSSHSTDIAYLIASSLATARVFSAHMTRLAHAILVRRLVIAMHDHTLQTTIRDSTAASRITSADFPFPGLPEHNTALRPTRRRVSFRACPPDRLVMLRHRHPNDYPCRRIAAQSTTRDVLTQGVSIHPTERVNTGRFCRLPVAFLACTNPATSQNQPRLLTTRRLASLDFTFRYVPCDVPNDLM